MVDLSRIDISLEDYLMSHYLAQPRIGHTIQVLHMFSYLKSNKYMNLCFYPAKLNVIKETILLQDQVTYKAQSMNTLYSDAIDHIPINMLKPLGGSIQINAFVAADLAGEQLYGIPRDRVPLKLLHLTNNSVSCILSLK